MKSILVTSCMTLVAISVFGCANEEGPPGVEEGFCFPTGPDGDDYTEADEFCLEDYCPQRDCENKVVAGAMCDREGGTSPTCICDCCVEQPEVGGDPGSPEIWEEVYTCILGSDCEQNTPVRLQLVQKGVCGETIDWYLSISPDEVWEYTGTLESGAFNWEQIAPPGFTESGCWQFSDDGQRFNKRSAGPGFYCIGAGSRGAGSTPAALPSCAELEASGISDFTSCPAPPPAGPLD